MTSDAIDRALGKRFRALPPSESLSVIFSSIAGKSLSTYWTSSARTDASDILARLFEGPGLWLPRLELFATPNGGQLAQSNARVFELRKKLERFGLSIACVVDWSLGRGARHKPYYRLAWEDEISRTPGRRVVFYSIGRKREARRCDIAASPRSLKAEQTPSTQQGLF